MATFEFYSDPSHGWLRVARSELADLGLVARDFSSYSYISFCGLHVYLEEDCDAPKFFRIYEAKHGTTPTIVEKYSSRSSFIRNLARVQPWKVEA